MILLDTDIMVDVFRGFRAAVEWLASLPNEEILLPGFVVMELVQGSRGKAEQRKVERALRRYRTVWPSVAACDKALSVFTRLRLSQGIGIIDVLVA